ACSELMHDAVAAHHRLIRALIAKYRCYEVKTVGDSFVIACKSVFAAVQLVRELQQVLCACCIAQHRNMHRYVRIHVVLSPTLPPPDTTASIAVVKNHLLRLWFSPS
ncbi:receptor-type adenylate cyclase, partial [Trypanosoma conorhini]